MSTTPIEVPEKEVLAGAHVLARSNQLLPDWLQIPALGHDMRPIARLVVEAVVPLIAARVLREAADALYSADGPAHPLSIATWLRQRADSLTTGAAVPEAAPGPLDFEALAVEALDGIKAAYTAAGKDVESEAFRMHLAAKVAEEGAEALAAYLHVTGWARRPGTWEQFDAELADTVISAFLAATANGRDLNAAIAAKHAIVMSRGFKEPVVALRDVVQASTCNHTVEEGCTGHGDF